MDGHAPVHLMMMAHTLRIKNQDRVERIYDLKGSTVKREVKFGKNTARTKTLKDVDFIKLKKKEPINLIEIDQKFLIRQLQKDSEFLKSVNIMDYSLLLAVEQIDKKVAKDCLNKSESDSFLCPSTRHGRQDKRDSFYTDSVIKNRYTLESESGTHFYHIAVIDYLQEWDLNKKAERFFKT